MCETNAEVRGMGEKKEKKRKKKRKIGQKEKRTFFWKKPKTFSSFSCI